MSRHDWNKQVDAAAVELVEEFVDQIVEQLIDDGKASSDYNNDYNNGDSFFHENVVDRSYSLLEAAELLDALRKYEEEDDGLWQGLAPREAIAAQAAYTFGNAVADGWYAMIRNINSDLDIAERLEQINAQEDGATDVDRKWLEQAVISIARLGYVELDAGE